MAQQPAKRLDVSGVRIPGTSLEGGRAVAVIAIAIYVFLFVVLNSDRVTVNFVLFKFRTNELLGFLLIFVLGFAAGYIVRGRRLSRRQQPMDEHPVLDVASRDALPAGSGEDGAEEPTRPV
jgi:uncharacterized integral membrane protein